MSSIWDRRKLFSLNEIEAWGLVDNIAWQKWSLTLKWNQVTLLVATLRWQLDHTCRHFWQQLHAELKNGAVSQQVWHITLTCKRMCKILWIKRTIHYYISRSLVDFITPEHSKASKKFWQMQNTIYRFMQCLQKYFQHSNNLTISNFSVDL